MGGTGANNSCQSGPRVCIATKTAITVTSEDLLLSALATSASGRSAPGNILHAALHHMHGHTRVMKGVFA